MSPRRPRLRRQRGMTLVELLVSLAILAVVGVGLAAAVDAGLHTLGAGGVSDRLIGSAAAEDLEHAVGADVARAGCVVTAAGALGACPAAMPDFCSSGGAALCLAWPDPAGGCDSVRYRLGGTVLWRDSLTAAGARSSAELAREVRSLTATAPPVGGFTVAVSVDLGAGPAATPQQTSFTARPVVTEPRPC